MTIKSREFVLPYLGCIFIIIIASFEGQLQKTLLIASLLLFPMLDRDRSWLSFNSTSSSLPLYSLYFAFIIYIVISHPGYYTSLLTMIFLIALPEEFFFRGWLLNKMTSQWSNKNYANIITSALFAAVHMPSHGATALLIIFPSLAIGFLYQKYSNDIGIAILTHCTFNIVNDLYLNVRPNEIFSLN